MQRTNQAVLAAVEQDVLHPEVVRRAISRAINELNAPTDTVVPRRTGLQAELTVLEQELARLTAAVAQGGDLKPLLDGIQAREQRRRALQTELAGLEGLQPVTARDLQEHPAGGREPASRTGGDSSAARSPRAARSSKKLLVGRIVFRQREDGVYEFSGQASLGRIIAGLACTKTVVAPTGHAQGWRGGPGRSRASRGSQLSVRQRLPGGPRPRIAARSLTWRPTPAQDRGGEPALGVAPGAWGPAAGEAGGGRTSAPPAEVALIVPSPMSTTLPSGSDGPFTVEFEAGGA